MSMTSKKESQQQIDPQLAGDSQSLVNLFRLLASNEYEPNRGVTIAAPTGKQTAAFDMQNAASEAFGFDLPSDTAMPATQKSALGIEGFTPAVEFDAAREKVSPERQALMSEFYNLLSKEAAPVEQKKIGGGK